MWCLKRFCSSGIRRGRLKFSVWTFWLKLTNPQKTEKLTAINPILRRYRQDQVLEITMGVFEKLKIWSILYEQNKQIWLQNCKELLTTLLTFVTFLKAYSGSDSNMQIFCKWFEIYPWSQRFNQFSLPLPTKKYLRLTVFCKVFLQNACVNPFHPSVAFDMETSHIWSIPQIKQLVSIWNASLGGNGSTHSSS